ncbi:MAG: DMT family transporter [Firmicutes bacterium]|nr:DMT family transporter [Bacillota bacterium]
MSKQLKADGMILLVTLGWGTSYYLTDISLTEMDPFTLNSYRFLGAFCVAAIICCRKLVNVTRETLRYSLIIGISLFFVYIGSTFGVKYTTLSNAAFLCSLTVVIVPILQRILFKKKTSRKLLFILTMCTTGIALLTLGEDFSINMANLKGDLLSMMTALFYAFELIMTEKAVSNEKVDALQIGIFSLGVTGICNLALAFIVETPVLPQSAGVWGAVAFLSIFCTGVALIVQPIAQRFTSAEHVCVIYALEPVFAAIVAYLFAGEVLIPRAYFGAFLMFAATILMELDFSSLQKLTKNITEDKNL